MATPILDEVDAMGFEADLANCSTELKEIVAYLRCTAQHAGTDVISRRYRHRKPNTGWGITYYSGGNRFCELHPKRNANHVWGFIRGADSAALESEGFHPSAQEGWFQIRTMPEAVRFVKWILCAHDDR
jgi:hypothetical protein